MYKRQGTLPDFGNWSIRQDEEKRNELYALYQRGKPPTDDEIKSIGDICIEKHDPYEGMKIILPYAKGVSAKSQFFDLQGNESSIDYNKMGHHPIVTIVCGLFFCFTSSYPNRKGESSHINICYVLGV